MKITLLTTRNELFGFTSIIMLLWVLYGCSEEVSSTQSKPDPVLRVVVEPVKYTTQLTRIEAVGTSRAIQSVTIYPASSGEVTAVNFEPGQKVKEGDILIELDNRDQILAVELAKVRLEDAERLYDRYLRTEDSGAVLPTTIDAARTAVEAAGIELDRARNALEDRTVEAPLTGHVGVTEVDPGDRIREDTAITTLDNREALLVSFEVPELMTGRLNTGDQVSIATWNSRSPAAYGDIVDIGSRIDPITRTFIARAKVDNSDDILRPGMSFRVILDIHGESYPVVPEIAMQWGADGSYVWSVENEQVLRVPVSIVQRLQGRVLVDTSLNEGELIVVEGIQRMYEGAKISYDLRNPENHQPRQ